MKQVDMSSMRLIHCGDEWPHEQVSLCLFFVLRVPV